MKKLPTEHHKFNSGTNNIILLYLTKKKQFLVIQSIRRHCWKNIFSKAVDIRPIPAKSLKEAANVLACPLSRIINLSVKLSIFPEEYKITKLKLIFKEGSKTDPKNYRSSSLLPLLSKITEKSIHYQLQDYLKDNGLLLKYQSRVRANFYADFVLTCMDKTMHTGMILIDLQKAFGTLDHKILLKKWHVLFWAHVVKQYHTVEYLRYHLHSNLSGESMAVKI